MLISIALFSFSACGNAEAEKKVKEEKEAVVLDSLSRELEKSKKEVEDKTAELEKDLEELKNLIPAK